MESKNICYLYLCSYVYYFLLSVNFHKWLIKDIFKIDAFNNDVRFSASQILLFCRAVANETGAFFFLINGKNDLWYLVCINLFLFPRCVI